jgi:hypothetical protein
MNDTLPPRPTYIYTERDWVQLRAHFMGSILVDVHLHKLAQNIGASWPIKDKNETPARYLEYSFEELADAPGLKGQPARLQLLLDTLKETASFDSPFQEMVQTSQAPEKSNENSAQLLRRVGVPTDYPVEFIGLSCETRSLCEAEGAKTVGEAVVLLQGMAQSVIVGGEVRQFLNSLAHGDLHALAKFLPVRAGTRGVYLAEAIGLLIQAVPESARRACLEPTPAAGPTPASTLAEATIQELRERLPRILQWFPEETRSLSEVATNGESLERFFATVGMPDVEKVAAKLARLHFGPPVEIAADPATVTFIGRIAKMFRPSR